MLLNLVTLQKKLKLTLIKNFVNVMGQIMGQ